MNGAPRHDDIVRCAIWHEENATRGPSGSGIRNAAGKPGFTSATDYSVMSCLSGCSFDLVDRIRSVSETI